MNKKMLIVFVLVMSIVMITGCSTFKGIFGKKATAEQKQATKIENVEDKINTNTANKLDKISEFSYGVGYSLDKITNASIEVISAKELNTRILTLSGVPNIESINQMKLLVDNMFTNNYKLLIKKDNEINLLQVENKKLVDQRETEIDKYKKLAKDTAITADTTANELSTWTSWWGLGGIVKGAKMFIGRIILVIIILAIIFIVLRFASLSNPIAASIFSVVERIASWGINIITTLAPKALDKAGAISKMAYNNMSMVLKKIVDNIQNIKQIETRTGQPITLKELLVELDKSMDKAEKDVIDKIKKDLGYN
jgi:hypothetical protein